jgi:aspartate/methionine/tyrosine aminotransferase
MRMTMADVADAADKCANAIRLENADTCLMPPPAVVQATRSAVGVDEFNSYLPLRGLDAMREAISARYKADFRLAYDPDGEIVVSCGAGESLLNALLAVVDPGDGVVITNPTYSGMAQRIRLAEGKQIFVPLHQRNGRWHLDRGRLRTAAVGAKAILYASPVMPTGSVITSEETDAIVEAAIENDAWIIFNGAADKVVFEEYRITNPASRPGGKERTIVIGCMSKNYAMPGWRIGWAAGPRDALAAMEDIHIFNGIMPSGFAQAGAIAALTGPQDWTRQHVKTYQDGQRLLADAIAGSPLLELTPAEGGFNCLMNVRGTGLTAVDFSDRLLREEKVAVTPMRGWGSDDFGEYVVRLIYSNEPAERLVEGGRRIAAFANRSRVVKR